LTPTAVIAALQAGNITDAVLQSAGDLLSVDAAQLSVPEAERLKTALLDALHHEQSPHRAASLIWVLGKSGDPQFEPIYLQRLQQYAESILAANFGVYQVLIALDNLGAAIFESDAKGRSSQSLMNIENNLRQARAYLSRHETELPW